MEGRRFKQCWRCQRHADKAKIVDTQQLEHAMNCAALVVAATISGKSNLLRPNCAMYRGLPDGASLVKVDRFAVTASSFCNFFPEMENAFLRHGVRRHGISRKL
jgi:hypothetical protein